MDAAGEDASLQNGSLQMIREATQLSRIEYQLAATPNAQDGPLLADFVGTDADATPRFSALAATADNTSTIGLGAGVFCLTPNLMDPEAPPAYTWGGTLTKLATPTQTWQEFAWPAADDTEALLYSSHATSAATPPWPPSSTCARSPAWPT